MRFEAGQFVAFTYRPPAKPPKQPRQVVRSVTQPDGTVKQAIQTIRPKPEPPSDPNKHVLVLNPSYHGKVHGIDLARITPAEAQTLRAIFDPKVKAAVDRGEWPVEGAPPYPLVRDILRRMEPLEVIKNPVLAYQTLVKPFIRDKDCYRQYWDTYMYGARVERESSVKGPVVNPKPLFKSEGAAPMGDGKSLFKKV